MKKKGKSRILAYFNIKLANEWHPTKNGILTPYDVTYGSEKMVWWICKKGHEWEAKICSRSNGGDCPLCRGVSLNNNVLCASYPEAYMYLYYKSIGEIFEHNKKYSIKFGRRRYDFYLKNHNKYVEVTSYSKDNSRSIKQYRTYLRKIVMKRRFVENVLKANFEFLQIQLTDAQIKYVRKHKIN